MTDSTTIRKCCENLWLIAHSASESLRMWEAIAIHAAEIKKSRRHIHFWGSCQRLAMGHAIVDICKLYKDSKDPKEETLYRLKKLASLDIKLPDAKIKNSSLERIFRYRDKILVHKEIVSEEINAENRRLPSLEEFHILINLAKDACLSTGYDAPSATVNLSNSTKNVIYRVLNSPAIDNYQPSSPYSNFMKKNMES